MVKYSSEDTQFTAAVNNMAASHRFNTEEKKSDTKITGDLIPLQSKEWENVIRRKPEQWLFLKQMMSRRDYKGDSLNA